MENGDIVQILICNRWFVIQFLSNAIQDLEYKTNVFMLDYVLVRNTVKFIPATDKWIRWLLGGVVDTWHS